MCAISILCNPTISIQDINNSVILTDELSNPGCLINLLFTSNREPLTQHLWKAIYFSKLKQQKKKQSSIQKNQKKEIETILPHNIWVIIGAHFTYSRVRFKVLCILLNIYKKEKITELNPPTFAN